MVQLLPLPILNLPNAAWASALKARKKHLAFHGLAKGLNTYKGFITYKPVAEDIGMMDKFKEFEELL